jgi:DNA-binding transcriptional MerR regulator
VGFTALQAARLTGCTPAQLDYWAAHGVVTPDRGPERPGAQHREREAGPERPGAQHREREAGPERPGAQHREREVGDEYAFRDLVALRMVRALLDAGVPLARTRRAVSALVEGGDDLAGLRLVTDGTRVWACRDDGQILDALRHGQLALFVAVDRIAADVEADIREFAAERQSFVAGLRAAVDHPSA